MWLEPYECYNNGVNYLEHIYILASKYRKISIFILLSRTKNVLLNKIRLKTETQFNDFS